GTHMIRKRSRRDSETAGNGARVTRCYFIVQATGWVSRAGGAAGPLPDHVARIGGSEEPNAGVSWWTGLCPEDADRRGRSAPVARRARGAVKTLPPPRGAGRIRDGTRMGGCCEKDCGGMTQAASLTMTAAQGSL